MNEIPSVHVLILSVDGFLMGTKHPNRQVLQRYTLHKYWVYSLSAMNIVVDDCHLLGSYFCLGGGG